MNKKFGVSETIYKISNANAHSLVRCLVRRLVHFREQFNPPPSPRTHSTKYPNLSLPHSTQLMGVFCGTTFCKMCSSQVRQSCSASGVTYFYFLPRIRACCDLVTTNYAWIYVAVILTPSFKMSITNSPLYCMSLCRWSCGGSTFNRKFISILYFSFKVLAHARTA